MARRRALSAWLLLALSFAACQAERPKPPFITASPNPVTTSPDVGGTTVTWNTGDQARTARVSVSVNGAPEVLFAAAAAGTKEAPWIGRDAEYEFRLYDARSNALIGAVKVTGRSARPPWRTIAIGAVVVLLVAAGLYAVTRRVRRPR